MNLNGDTVRTAALEPQLDVIALGHDEDRLFFNPTPEADSLFELLPLVVADRSPATLTFARLLSDARSLNGDQVAHARTVAGFLDGLATDLRSAQRTDSLRATLSAKSIARALRPHLRTLADAERVDATALAALRSINRVAAETARAQLLSRAVAHELGRGPFELLREVLA